ncbi:MAG: hypothetical protein MJ169_01710 [Treponema sp.]|nr:hypothetical protein [Treponema sp.]
MRTSKIFGAFFACSFLALSGAFADPNVNHFTEELIQKANEGNLDAMLDLGYICEPESNSSAQKYDQSIAWYNKAAEAGVVQAYEKLARIYLKIKDFEKARQCCEYFAWQGIPVFQELMAEICAAESDMDDAFYWYFKVQEENPDKARSDDEGKLGELFLKAYYGDAQSQYTIAKIMYSGKDVPSNSEIPYTYQKYFEGAFSKEDAGRWLKRSAEQGFAQAVNEYYWYFPGEEPDIIGVEKFYKPEIQSVAFIDAITIGNDWEVRINSHDESIVRFSGTIDNYSLHDVNDAKVCLYLTRTQSGDCKTGTLLAEKNLETIMAQKKIYVAKYVSCEVPSNSSYYLTVVLYQNGLPVQVKLLDQKFGSSYYNEEDIIAEEQNRRELLRLHKDAVETAHAAFQNGILDTGMRYAQKDIGSKVKPDNRETVSYEKPSKSQHIAVPCSQVKYPELTGNWKCSPNQKDGTFNITGTIENLTSYTAENLRYEVYCTQEKYTGAAIPGIRIFKMDCGNLPANHKFEIDDEGIWSIPEDGKYFVTIMLILDNRVVSYVNFKGKLEVNRSKYLKEDGRE